VNKKKPVEPRATKKSVTAYYPYYVGQIYKFRKSEITHKQLKHAFYLKFGENWLRARVAHTKVLDSIVWKICPY